MKTAAKKNSRSGSRGVMGKSKKSTSASRTNSRTRATKKSKSSSKPSKPKASSKKQEPSNEDAMKKLFHEMLKDTLNAEKQLVKALPKMAKGATSKQLASAIKKHLSETEKQVKRLEKVFALCDLKIAGKKCEAMEGLVKEGKEALEETPKGSLVRDVAIIVAAQKVEHYEIASYGSLRSIAEVCGYTKAAELLQQTLDEEAETDKKLTALSESLNPKASGQAEGGKSKPKAKGKSSPSAAKVEEAIYLDDDSKDEEEEDDDDITASYDDEDDEESDDMDDDEKEEEEDSVSPGMGKSL